MQRLNPSKKKFAPVRVVNPIADNHLVCLRPNQRFMVVLSSWFALVDIQWTSEYFSCFSDDTLRDGTRIFEFRPKFDLTNWAKIGGAYLGEVVVIGNETASSLCVVLASEKSDVFTVVNPEGNEVKLQPHQILEVVLYNSQFLGRWDCKIIPGDDGIRYREIGHESIKASTDIHSLASSLKENDFVVFPRAFDDFDGMEHHYWFEYDAPSIRRIQQWKTGSYQGGRLIFEPATAVIEGYASPNVLHCCLNVKGGRSRKRMAETKRLPDSLPFASSPEEDADDTVLEPESSGALVLSEDSNFDDYDDFVIGGINHHRRKPKWSGGSSNSQSYISYNAKPLVQAVSLREKTIADTLDPIEAGATTIECNAPLPVNLQTNSRWSGTHYDY